MRDDWKATNHGYFRVAVSVTARFALDGKIYPESIYWHGSQYPIEKIRKVSYFCGDAYASPDRVFLIEHSGGSYHLYYVGQRWFVHISDSHYRSENCDNHPARTRRSSKWKSRRMGYSR